MPPSVHLFSDEANGDVCCRLLNGLDASSIPLTFKQLKCWVLQNTRFAVVPAAPLGALLYLTLLLSPIASLLWSCSALPFCRVTERGG